MDVSPLQTLPHEDRVLTALFDVSRVLSMLTGQRQMLVRVLDILQKQLDMTRGTIMLLSLDGSGLFVEAAIDLHDSQRQGVRYQRGEGIVGGVLQTGKPAVIPLISEEPRFQDRIHRRKQSPSGPLSFICVPIAVEGEVEGTLSVDIPYSADVSLDQQQRVLSVVAGIIANDVKARRMAKLQCQMLEAENLRLRSALGEQFRPESIVGNSHAMDAVYQAIHQVSRSDTTVLIRGESGTGKELVAAAIHYGSLRAGRPFVRVNCAALSQNLIESELFGHEKGAFTGALHTRVGRIEEAGGGTLFLDEIGDFSPATQVKLLRVLQEREIQRVGSGETIKADVRILAATNRDLEAAIDEGHFRTDLYYRINVFPITLPPLRERKDDILLLADHFVQKHAHRMEKSVRRISTTAINLMTAYHWPGNVRELENCIEHAVLLTTDGVIHGHNLPPALQEPEMHEGEAAGSLGARVRLLEKDVIIDALKRCDGRVAMAAKDLGITMRMVRYKMKHLNIDHHKYSPRGPKEGRSSGSQ